MPDKPTTFQKALRMLTPREKKTGALVVGLMVLKGFADMISVASVMPFLSLLGNPSLVDTNPIARFVFSNLGFEDIATFIAFIGISIVVFLIAVNVLRSITAYALNHWTAMREYSFSQRLLSVYMRQPYEFFLHRRTDELHAFILGESARVVKECYKPAGEITNASMSFVMIALFLIWVEPVTTLVSVAVFGGCYYGLYYGLRPLLRKWGQEVVATNKARFHVASEALNGVKPIKLLGQEQTYLSAFSKPSKRQAKVRAINATLRQIPKFALETLAFGGIIIMALVLAIRTGDIESGSMAALLPTLGLYAVAGYRLLPTMQTMYVSAATLKFGGSAIEAIYDDISKADASAQRRKAAPTPLNFSRKVAFENISYRFPGADEDSLKDVSFEISRGMTIGVVGTTGAGKTTLVDVFLGLLPVSSGSIVVDDESLTEESLRRWQSIIGYVPQDVFLIDASVKENIAFGLPQEEIDDEAVREAALSAQIHEFVATQMPEGYDTAVGERGVRLSGGQRQRIGIARALYHRPEIIVFDEATSALDNVTERDLMKEINALSKEKTIIMIAHRLSTVQKCDKILVLDRGKLAGVGSYDELLAENAVFQRLTHLPD